MNWRKFGGQERAGGSTDLTALRQPLQPKHSYLRRN